MRIDKAAYIVEEMIFKAVNDREDQERYDLCVSCTARGVSYSFVTISLGNRGITKEEAIDYIVDNY